MSETSSESIAKSGIEQLIKEVESAIAKTESVDVQMSDLSTLVNNFVGQVLGVVDGNKDIPAVNELLTNSLLQLKKFVEDRPEAIKTARQSLEQKLSAYQQCLIILTEAERTVAAEKVAEKSKEKKKKRIKEHIDKSRSARPGRKPGTRPEKLRDIRQVEKELSAQKNHEGDN